VQGKYVTASCGVRPYPPKCEANACANEPKPPRVTPPEPEAVPDEELDTESPPKKLVRRDHELPDPPDPLLDEYPRAEQLVAVCGDDGAAIPGAAGSQLLRGISA
jgi:hypothetical protein